MNGNFKKNKAFASFTKDLGPPYKHFAQDFDPIEHNDYLVEKGVDVEALRNIHAKGELTA